MSRNSHFPNKGMFFKPVTVKGNTVSQYVVAGTDGTVEVNVNTADLKKSSRCSNGSIC
ncbi:hypothetical protein [Paenibacillus cremeus]|uniref:hypothetical protein n=1 Tax=Paenibacillus cremeus TaxID=2163881 RepID=UPI0016454724|nr:hypothetical protein [Paenibacillus cremeus]